MSLPSAPRHRGDRLAPALFALASFASALLLFLVQPMVGKRILPWFGGVPAVWSLCLAFYQTTLFAGYAYAHLLVRRATPRVQLGVHTGLVGAALLVLPVLPDDAWQPAPDADPTAAILWLLVAHVALPFGVLAATGPLVQAWFARRFPARSPYPLYALSNAGSLLALLAYPVLFEPRLSLSALGRAWSGGFAVAVALVLACALLALQRNAPSEARSEPAGSHYAKASLPWILWSALAGAAVVLLMAVTNHLCLDVASVPFLWILPLAIYLVTLIVCFGIERALPRSPWILLAVAALAAPVVVEFFGWHGGAPMRNSLPAQITRYGLLLFGACMALHGELHRLRPQGDALTAYYLCIAGGGALGGIAVGVLAPHVFADYYELPLGLAFGWGLLLFAYRRDPSSPFGGATARNRWLAALALSLLACAIAGTRLFERPRIVLHQERSFFGVLRVTQNPDEPTGPRLLRHGTTIHGVQLLDDPERPTSYYGINTGIGLVLGKRESEAPPRRVAVIGLGTGSLAAYGRPGDTYRFYEIDPAVLRIARSHFTFLADSEAAIELVQGDGRVALALDRARGVAPFDVLAVDAYSSDAVPIHLLTREALALYVDATRPDGVIAIHTSSVYFDLAPLLARHAEALGLHSVSLTSPKTPRFSSGQAQWTLLSTQEERIAALARFARRRLRALGMRLLLDAIRRPTPEWLAGAPDWTDDHSDLFSALKTRNLARGGALGP